MRATVLICGYIFDGSSDELSGPAEILVKDNRIASIGPAANRPPEAHVIDISERTVTLDPLILSMAQQQLRNMLSYLDMPTMGQPEAFLHVAEDFFDQNGDIARPDTREFLQHWMDAYVAWVKKCVPSVS